MIEDLRLLNIVIGVIALICLLLQVNRSWSGMPPAQRLRYMSLILIVMVVTFGTYEILYLDTVLRVPAITVALTWAVASTFYHEKR